MTRPTHPRRVVLVGFMGAGKTSVGRLLAARLGWRFEDLDARIVARAGASVAELFARQGETAFRALERAAAAECLDLEDCVLATGGGAWVQAETRALLARDACTVWLRADLDTLLARLPDDGSRPLLGNRERMRALMNQREPLYAGADISISALDAPERIADQLLALLFPERQAEPRGARQP
jgi:shikimate kinase